MYYAYDLFVKKGPLGTIWLAGNFPRKISKQSILTSNVLIMCESVLNPPVQLALPTQSTLLRGVVRIENKKATYLLNDATDARNQLRVVVRTSLSLPPKQLQAKPTVISLEELDPALMIDTDIDIDAVMAAAAIGIEDREHVDLSIQRDRYREPSLAHLARAEEITLSQISQVTPTPMTPLEWEHIPLEALEMEIPEIEGMEDISLPAQPVPVTPASVMSEEEQIIAVALAAEEVEERVPRRRVPRVRKFVVDAQTELSDDIFRMQLQDTSDITIQRPSRRPPPMMEAKQALASVNMPSSVPAEHMPPGLLAMFQSACAPDSAAEEEAAEKRAVEEEAPAPVEYAASVEQMEEEWMASEEQALEPSALELEVARGRISAELEPVAARTSFLGLPYDEASDSVSRRVSLLPLEREMSARRRGTISPVPLLATPDVAVPESQFSIPIEELSVVSEETEVARRAYTGVEISRLTEMFRAILEQQFRDAEFRLGTADVSLVFDTVLTEAMRGSVTRRDAALAFFQLLVLRTLDITNIKQINSYGDLEITKGMNWGERLSSSQL